MSTHVKANCHCGINSFSLEFRTESLPLSNVICHCNTCRRSTGQLYRHYTPFEGEPVLVANNQPGDFQHLSHYKTSPTSERWFCSTCSAHLFAQSTKVEGLRIAIGALEDAGKIVKSQAHIWVSDTLDGGAADCLSVIDGVQLPRFVTSPLTERTMLPVGWRAVKSDETQTLHDELSAECHCGSIAFSITRPSAASASLRIPYPSFLVPTDATPSQRLNPDDEKWWLRPAGSEHPTHYLACHCACSSCRLTSGSEIQSSAFVPRVNILVRKDGSTSPVVINLQDAENRPKGLKQYESSPGRFREFCGNCGANVFMWRKVMPDFIVVSTGLFDEQQGGSRCEGWLEWFKGGVSFSEDAIRKTFVEGFERGLKQLK